LKDEQVSLIFVKYKHYYFSLRNRRKEAEVVVVEAVEIVLLSQERWKLPILIIQTLLLINIIDLGLQDQGTEMVSIDKLYNCTYHIDFN